MKIAFIDQSFHWPPRGGSWVDLRETAIRLQRMGDDIRIFTPLLTRWNVPGGRIERDPGVPVTTIPMRLNQFQFKTAPVLIHREVMAWKPERIMIGNTFFLAPHILETFSGIPLFLRIYAHETVCSNYMGMCRGDVFKSDRHNPTGKLCDGSMLKTPVRCWRCALRRMLPTLIGPRLNEVAFEYFTSLAFLPGYARRTRRVLGNLHGILVYNPFIRDLVAPFGPPVHVVPAGVDTARFTPAQRNPEKTVRILLPGRADDPRKGFSVFAGAVDILLKKGLNVEALVTDPRPSCPHPAIKTTGWISTENLPDLYRSVDIIVCPSIWPEPFGIIPLESMACGIPVVASNIGGMQYTVVHGETGYLFETGNSADMAARLETLAHNPDLRKRMGIEGRKRAESLFEWDRIITRFTAPVLHGTTEKPVNWLETGTGAV
jgi:glycosyltransferase involved in cell wall biosynthesis